MSYVGRQPASPNDPRTVFEFTAPTTGTVTFSGLDVNGLFFGYTIGQLNVSVAGALLDSTRLTAADGATMTITGVTSGQRVRAEVIGSAGTVAITTAATLAVAGDATFSSGLGIGIAPAADARLDVRSYGALRTSNRFSRLSDTAAQGATLSLSRARGTTDATIATPIAGDSLGMLQFQAWDSTAWATGASVEARIPNGTSWSPVSRPAELLFYTNPNGSTARAIGMVLTSDALLGIGTSTPEARAHVYAADGVAGLKVTQNGTGFAFMVDDVVNDTSPFVIDGDGTVLVGTTAVVTLASGVPRQQVHSTGITAQDLFSWGNATTHNIGYAKSRGGSAGTFGAVLASDMISQDFRFDTGTGFIHGARIVSMVETAPTATTIRTGLSFSTRSATDAGVMERLRIDGAGNVGIGTGGPTSRLDVRDAVAGSDTVLRVANTDATGMSGIVSANSDGTGFLSIGALNSASTLTATYGLANEGLVRSSLGLAGLVLSSANTTSGYIRTLTNGVERTRVDLTGRFLVGTPTNITSHQVQFHSGSSNAGLSAGRWENTVNGPEFSLLKSRSGTVGTFGVATPLSDTLGMVSFRGDTGMASSTPVASILAVAAELFTPTATGAHLYLRTTPNGTTTALTRIAVTESGFIGINTSTPSARLHVNASAAGETGLLITQTGASDALIVQDMSGDASPFVIDSAGCVIAGHTVTTNLTVNGFSTSKILSVSTTSEAGLTAVRFSTDASGPDIRLLKSRSATVGTLSAPVVAGDVLGRIVAAGDDGVTLNAFAAAAAVTFVAEATPTVNSLPGAVLISTTNAGSTTAVERVRVTSAGKVGIGTNVPAAVLDVLGDFGITHANLASVTVTTASTAVTILDTLPIATYRSASYDIQVTSAGSYHTVQLRVLHNGATAWNTETGEMLTGSSLGSFSTDVTGGNLRVLFTAATAATTVVKAVRTAIKV